MKPRTFLHLLPLSRTQRLPARPLRNLPGDRRRRQRRLLQHHLHGEQLEDGGRRREHRAGGLPVSARHAGLCQGRARGALRSGRLLPRDGVDGTAFPAVREFDGVPHLSALCLRSMH